MGGKGFSLTDMVENNEQPYETKLNLVSNIPLCLFQTRTKKKF